MAGQRLWLANVSHPNILRKNPKFTPIPHSRQGNSPPVATEQVQRSPDVNILLGCIARVEKCRGVGRLPLTHRGG